MLLESLELYNFRNFSSLRLDFNDRLTVLVGNNGQVNPQFLRRQLLRQGL